MVIVIVIIVVMTMFDCCVVQDISRVYQILTDEMLGSGQFGVVFGGTAQLLKTTNHSSCWIFLLTM